MNAINNLDHELFLFLNGLHVGWLDPVMTFISSEMGWIPFYVILLYLVFKKLGWKGLLFVVIGVVVLITCSDQLSSHVFKPVFHRFRPCHDPLIQDLVHLPNGHCGGQYGFISSHACNTFALASFITLIMKRFYKKIGLLMFIWAALVSYSRIYMGVHFPGDVLCGAAVGMILGFGIGHLLLMVMKKIQDKSARNQRV
ncbi:MAG: phosphatase PAP2 family protein [Bacteroidales bacterium]|nr:phosphatase PAP2 family protein [Bacteroidales bacterium]